MIQNLQRLLSSALEDSNPTVFPFSSACKLFRTFTLKAVIATFMCLNITRSLLNHRICFFLCFLSRCRQVMPAPPIHGQEVPPATRSDHRRWVWSPHDPNSRKEHQAADLGHGRSGIFQEHHAVILSRCSGGPSRLWHHKTRYVHTSDQVARRGQAKRQPWYVNHAHWQ